MASILSVSQALSLSQQLELDIQQKNLRTVRESIEYRDDKITKTDLEHRELMEISGKCSENDSFAEDMITDHMTTNDEQQQYEQDEDNLNNSITCAINAAIAIGLAQHEQQITQRQQQQGCGIEDHVCGDCQEVFKNKVSFNLHRRQKHGDRQHCVPTTPRGNVCMDLLSTPSSVDANVPSATTTPTIALFSLSTPPNVNRIVDEPMSNTREDSLAASSKENAVGQTSASTTTEVDDADISANDSGSAGSKTFTCEYCGELYKSRPSFTRHKNRAHPFASFLTLPSLTLSNVQPPSNRRRSALAGKTRTVRCGKCDGTVSNQSNLCAHLREKHQESTALIEQARFSSMADFYAWKDQVERVGKSVYLKRRKKEHGEARKHYYYCRRSGCFESKANGIRARVSNKVGYHCTGFMTACENMKTNEVHVEYCTFHYCQDEQAMVRAPVPAGSAGPSHQSAGLTRDVKTEQRPGVAATAAGRTEPINRSVPAAPQAVDGANVASEHSVRAGIGGPIPAAVTVIPLPILAEFQQQQMVNSSNLMQQRQQNSVPETDRGLQTQQRHIGSVSGTTASLNRSGAIASICPGSSLLQHQFGQTTLRLNWENANNVKTTNPSNKDSKSAVCDIKNNSEMQSGSGSGLSSTPHTLQPPTLVPQPASLVNMTQAPPQTTYIGPIDVGTLYGYELVEQGKIVCNADNITGNMSYAGNPNDPVSIFVAGNGSNANLNIDSLSQQIQIHLQQQQQVQIRQQNSDKNLTGASNSTLAGSGTNTNNNGTNPMNANASQQSQQSLLILKETVEYVDCASNNLKLGFSTNLSDKKCELLKSIHERAIELFNLTMWMNEDERSKRAGTFTQTDEQQQYTRQTQGYDSFGSYDHTKTTIVPNQQQQQHNENEEERFIKITVVSPQNAGQVDEIRFRIKSTTELGKLKRSYAERIGVFVASLRFLYHNHVIGDDETPQMVFDLLHSQVTI